MGLGERFRAGCGLGRSGNIARIIYGGSLEVRLEVALAAEGLLAALALELVRVHVEVVCKD